MDNIATNKVDEREGHDKVYEREDVEMQMWVTGSIDVSGIKSNLPTTVCMDKKVMKRNSFR